MLAGMDRNTMIVRLAEALLYFAAAVIVVLRLDDLWRRLHALQLRVGNSFQLSLRFFRPEQGRTPDLIYKDIQTFLRASGTPILYRLIITHPDDDHRIFIAPHYARRT